MEQVTGSGLRGVQGCVLSPCVLNFGEGNGTPLQYSCPENPMDGGAWWAAVYGVTQSRTRLKRLSSSSRDTKEDLKKLEKSYVRGLAAPIQLMGLNCVIHWYVHLF